MTVIEQLTSGIALPKMVKATQKFDPQHLSQDELEKLLLAQLRRDGIKERIKPGMRIAVTCGSRGIRNIAKMTRIICDEIKARGASPVLVPTMGSHGGATAKGQIEIVESFGITEEAMGAPILSSMEVVKLGVTGKSKIEVCYDKNAYECDGVIVFNRIKPHTTFRGPIESGLCKMIAIGLGKQQGAEACHSHDMRYMSGRIQELAEYALEHANILFGIGIIENAFDETQDLISIASEDIMKEEPALLVRAFKNLPRIIPEDFDVLIVDEIGKNISGTGVDTNIVGRFTVDSMPKTAKYQRLVFLDLTEASHGNANGAALADYSTKRLFNKFSMEATYPNPLTTSIPYSAKIPMILYHDRMAISAAVKSCYNLPDTSKAKIVRIKNTLELEEIEVSEPMVDYVRSLEGVTIASEPYEFPFDKDGNLF